mgnify:CR=1 FL=1
MTETQDRFSGPIIIFQERRLPEKATPAGYSALIDAYTLSVPLPRTLTATGQHHRTIEDGGWRILTPRHAPNPTLEGHLTFALKYEGLDLVVLKRLFLTTGPNKIEAIVRDKPSGAYARRIWFLYEWLTGETLGLPDASGGRYVPVIDPDLQYAPDGETAPRYRVKNNMPGTPDFCPLVHRTKQLDEFAALDLPRRAQEVVADVPRDLLARTAAFLLLKDSKSSYAIEGESPPQDRIQRWGRAIGEAGQRPLDLEELLRLQRVVIGDARFVKIGLRQEGGFVGEHDRDTRMPLPDHISARHEDLSDLLNGMIGFDQGPAGSIDPVNPPGVVFPVSAAILEQIDAYRSVLESYSERLLPLIEWEATDSFNVRVLNDTGDFYRFFDATPHAEFLYACVRKTIEEDLPNETGFLRRYDHFKRKNLPR